MKYSKKTREEAALLCAIAASNWPTVSAAATLRRSPRLSRELALAALRHVCTYPGDGLDQYAEAESLIRTGWSP